MTTKSLLAPDSAILTNIAKTDLEKIHRAFNSSMVEVQTIYHKDCLDGSVSAFVAWLKLDTHQPVGVSYADSLATQLLQSEERCTLLFVDFSWNPDVLIELANHGHNVIIVDHHTSAIDKIMAVPKNDVNFWYFLASEKVAVEDNQKHSGCSLAMEFFKYVETPKEDAVEEPEGLARLVSLTREHDLWLHNGDPASDAMALAYWHKNKSFDDLRTIWNETDLSVEAVNAMVAEGRVHLDKAVSEINEVIKCGCMVEIGGRTAWLFYCERAYTSLAGSIVNKKLADVAVSFYREGEKFKMSIRTSDISGVDASELAAIYGGGGHQHAAGFYTDVYPAVLLKRSPPPPVALASNVVINPNQA